MRIRIAESAWPRGAQPTSILVVLFLCASSAMAADYLSPVPGSRNVSPWNNVIIRHGVTLAPDQIMDTDLAVAGSRSGLHPGKLVLSDDSKTLVFLPAAPFALGERVSVQWERGPKTAAGDRLPPLAFHFSVATADPKRQAPARSFEDEMPPASVEAESFIAQVATSQSCDTLPSSYIPLTATMINDPPPGYVYMTPFSAGFSGGRLVILDNRGQPVFVRRTAQRTTNFSRQANGLLTYFEGGAYWALDDTYAVVDSFAMGNGYLTDNHDMRLLPNGHAILMAYDGQPVGMDTVVAGGNPDAIVAGLILQEIDTAKNVVAQWRSWDHFQITDMVEVPGRLLTGSSIDYVHGNAIEVEPDGNLLISSRHMNEITKIAWPTGEILWRLGKNAKNNQFSFPNDPRGYSHQHDIRRLPNGNITLYDNGNFVDPERSRGVEYVLDEQNKIATQVWEYRNTPDVFGRATGSTRRDDTGATLICWGITNSPVKLTELHADGSKAFEVTSNPGTTNYRGIRAPWQTNLFVTDADPLDFGAVELGTIATLPLSIHNNATTALELTCIVSTDPAFTVEESTPFTIPAGGDAVIHVEFVPPAIGSYAGTLYLKSIHGADLVSQVVAIQGSGEQVTGVGSPNQSGPWLKALPNPSAGATSLAFGMPKAGRAELRIYDLRGRLLATPFSGVAGPGLHEVKWDGRSDEGEVLHSGIYFARLTSAAGERSLKLSLSR